LHVKEKTHPGLVICLFLFYVSKANTQIDFWNALILFAVLQGLGLSVSLLFFVHWLWRPRSTGDLIPGKTPSSAGKQRRNLTMIALAEEAGFNSKSSFNKVFKDMTGMTPTEYKKSP